MNNMGFLNKMLVESMTMQANAKIMYVKQHMARKMVSILYSNELDAWRAVELVEDQEGFAKLEKRLRAEGCTDEEINAIVVDGQGLMTEAWVTLAKAKEMRKAI